MTTATIARAARCTPRHTPRRTPRRLPRKGVTSCNTYLRIFERETREANYYELLKLRQKLVRKYAWAIPNDEALETIAKYGPVVEIGAGTGYWASLLAARGVDVRAFDSSPVRNGKNPYFETGKETWGLTMQAWFPVEQGQATVAARFPHRTLFLCWPPFDTGMARVALEAYRGDTVIFIGESLGGCTGDEAFHEMLDEQFECVEAVAIPRWNSIHDSLTVWKRVPGTR